MRPFRSVAATKRDAGDWRPATNDSI